MKNKLDLSIIIPVYNVENYLSRCLESIVLQDGGSLKYEIIAVNDGSTDNSLAILKQFSLKFDQLIVLDTANSGAGSARNRGLEVASGAFIWFVDADDFVEPGVLDLVYKEAILKDESIGFNFYRYSEEEGKVPAKLILDREPAVQRFKGLEYTFGNRDFYIWTLLLRRSLIEKHNLRFIEGIKNIEDLEFVTRYFALEDDMTFYNKRLYNYNQTNVSSTSRLRSSAHLEKLASDSAIVHRSLQKEMQKYPDLDFWLNKSIIGFFNSLRMLYSREDFIKYYRDYKKSKLLPVKIFSNYSIKYKLFGWLLNYAPFFLYPKK